MPERTERALEDAERIDPGSLFLQRFDDHARASLAVVADLARAQICASSVIVGVVLRPHAFTIDLNRWQLQRMPSFSPRMCQQAPASKK
jgi:hypothetical protein